MGISVGDRLPEAAMTQMGAEGRPEPVQLSQVLAGRKVVIFALPGAYTGACSTVHLPSFMRTADDIRAKGVDEIICIAVNDAFVLDAWGEATGAKAAGIRFLGDAEGQLTNALGMAFDAPVIGLMGRSNRYAALVEDGVVTAVSIDEPGVCDVSTGERFLEALA